MLFHIGKYTKYNLSISFVFLFNTYTILYKYAGSAKRQLPNQINIITPVTVLLEVFFLNGKTTARYLKQIKNAQTLYFQSYFTGKKWFLRNKNLD